MSEQNGQSSPISPVISYGMKVGAGFAGGKAIGLLFQRSRVEIAGIEIDATLREVHRTTVRVTDHPVESGASVSDHMIVEPDELELEGVVSNTPPIMFASSKSFPKRAETFYEVMKDAAQAGEVVTVVTTLRTYDDMVITSIEVPRDAETGDAVQFRMTLRRVVFAYGAEVEAPTMERAKPVKNLGRKPTADATPAESAKVRSILKLLAGG